MNDRKVIVKGGVAYSARAGAAIVNLGSSPADALPQVLNNNFPWSYWGANNLTPVSYAADLENTPALMGTIESKIRIALGRGLLPFILTDIADDGTETLKFINDPEILQWLDLNNEYLHGWKNLYNIGALGWGATQIILSADRTKINRIRATDVYQARLQKINDEKIIENMYLYGDWSQIINKDKLITIPVLEEENELADLNDKTTKDDGETKDLDSPGEFAMLHRMLKDGATYYPLPLWMTAKAWVDVAKSIPALKNTLNVNQISVKYVIIISPEYWKKFHSDWDNYEPEKQEQVMNNKYDEIANYLTGSDKQGKSITAGAYVDPITKQVIPDIQVNVIDDKMKEGKMLPDASAADKQIMMALLFNPAINGANLLEDGSSGGAGSGSDIREASIIQLLLMQAERMLNLKVFNLVKYYNGWYDRYKGQGMLVFRYQNTMLTTLDTGASVTNTQT